MTHLIIMTTKLKTLMIEEVKSNSPFDLEDDEVKAMSDLVLPGGEQVEERDNGTLELSPSPGVHCSGAGGGGRG